MFWSHAVDLSQTNFIVTENYLLNTTYYHEH